MQRGNRFGNHLCRLIWACPLAASQLTVGLFRGSLRSVLRTAFGSLSIPHAKDVRRWTKDIRLRTLDENHPFIVLKFVTSLNQGLGSSFQDDKAVHSMRNALHFAM